MHSFALTITDVLVVEMLTGFFAVFSKSKLCLTLCVFIQALTSFWKKNRWRLVFFIYISLVIYVVICYSKAQVCSLHSAKITCNPIALHSWDDHVMPGRSYGLSNTTGPYPRQCTSIRIFFYLTKVQNEYPLEIWGILRILLFKMLFRLSVWDHLRK